jgi:hypothetical protein
MKQKKEIGKTMLKLLTEKEQTIVSGGPKGGPSSGPSNCTGNPNITGGSC